MPLTDGLTAKPRATTTRGMIEPTIHGLSNEDYHNSEPYKSYLSSTALKWYLKSPKHYRYMVDNPTEEKSDALRFGSLFHDLMEWCSIEEDGDRDGQIRSWAHCNLAVFKPPINKSTGKAYGATSNPYKEAYKEFEEVHCLYSVVSQEEYDTLIAMGNSLILNSGSTSEQVRKLLKWGKPEVSFFYEFTEATEKGEEVPIKVKVRPDLLTNYKIVDWKTVGTDDLSEDSINRIILKYGYHISAAMYQWVVWKITGVWRDFYLVLVSKVPPYDCVIVNMCAVLVDIYREKHYGYGYCDEGDGIIVPGCGAMEFKRLLDLHIKCTKENHWPGAENDIPDNNGVRVLDIRPPKYYENQIFEL